jgi:hypothetical protein
MVVRWCDDFDARVAIAELIRSLMPPGPARDGFGGSIDAYARSDAYTFLIAFPDERGDQALGDACAVTIFSVYELPMANRAVLGVDALAVRAAELESAVEVLRVLARIAGNGGLQAVCLAESGVTKPGLVRALAERGRLDAEPIGAGRPLMMRRESAGVWSPFVDGLIPDRVFEAVPCLSIVTEDLTVDASGEPYTAAGPLYRGEGRLSCDGWECPTFDELTRHLRQVGFEPRSATVFAGTVPEQILHQGYVPQGTVSLSASFDVCAFYATFGGARPSGVVFTIDPDRLRAHAPIWDAYATLVRHCDWFFEGEFETLRTVVTALGVREAGRFLARCHAGTRDRVERTGGFEPLAGPIDWDAYLDGGLARLRAAGLEDARLAGLHRALEHYWMRALGQVAAEDVIHVGEGGDEPTVEERRLGVLAYEHAFLAAEPRLRTEALGPRDPGWDLTAFGYIAKTCRDLEYLSTGAVPPDSIVAATQVGNG